MKVDPSELVSMTDIADLLGVRQSAVTNWTKRYTDFPAPVGAVGRGRTRLFLKTEVISWWLGRHHADRVLELADTIRKLQSEDNTEQ